MSLSCAGLERPQNLSATIRHLSKALLLPRFNLQQSSQRPERQQQPGAAPRKRSAGRVAHHFLLSLPTLSSSFQAPGMPVSNPALKALPVPAVTARGCPQASMDLLRQLPSLPASLSSSPSREGSVWQPGAGSPGTSADCTAQHRPPSHPQLSSRSQPLQSPLQILTCLEGCPQRQRFLVPRSLTILPMQLHPRAHPPGGFVAADCSPGPVFLGIQKLSLCYSHVDNART